MTENTVCVDCARSTQKPVEEASVSPATGVCADVYEQVTICMKEHQGQIVPCAAQWQAFRQCHERNPQTRP